MQVHENKTTSSLLRSAGKFFRVVGILVVLLTIIVVVLIVVPTERDMRTRNLINARVQVGLTISDFLISFRNKNGFWPRDFAAYSQNEVDVLDDGLVRVYFEVPGSIEENWADLRVSMENGRYYRSCRAPGIKRGRLPAWCREGAGVEEVKLP